MQISQGVDYVFVDFTSKTAEISKFPTHKSNFSGQGRLFSAFLKSENVCGALNLNEKSPEMAGAAN